MSNFDTVRRVLMKHEGGWRDNGKPGLAHCWGCGYRPRIGEYHGDHVARAVLAALGIKED